ncbi:MAG: Gfo/Idh/MocA family oxidoreductase [Ruminococcaceae bacterium]|nr:Gfo/Idh/MocA family oxidoreductase [Oscillospiraceae bacterium]
MIKLGIIGSNFVSDWLTESVEGTEGIVNHALYSRTAERGAEFAAKHNIPTVYTNFDDFLTSDIDAVYVASPNKFHFPQAMAAMAKGKHVLCEKPIALDTAELDQMIETARKQGVVLLEAMRPAFDPGIDAAKTALPLLGQIRYARFEFCQYSSRYDRFKQGEVMNAFTPSLGNAALMDIGVYAVHNCVKLLGLPDLERITASSIKLSNGFEGMGNVLLPYEGFNAEILYSKIADSVQGSVILGENGGLTIDKMSVPSKVTLHLRGTESEDLPFEMRKNNMDFETEVFVKLIREGKVEHEYMANTRAAMQLMDRVRELAGIRFE